MMISAESWDATRASGAVVGTQALEAGAARPAWQIKREIMRRERHLGRRQVLYGAAAAIVAMLIFLPHWWLAQRFIRAPR
jgi:hypothetical protein